MSERPVSYRIGNVYQLRVHRFVYLDGDDRIPYLGESAVPLNPPIEFRPRKDAAGLKQESPK